MKTSIVGYPRIGKDRELKFAIEKYFKGDITQDKLIEISKELRKEHWQLQKESKIEFIPSNDFSLYDNILDTAVLLNVVPERYQGLDLEPLDKYFAMARGYQGKSGDVKAFAMKKWFNTNYHYLVPEIDKETKIKLVGRKIFDEYNEAKELNIETKPVLIGPFTFLKLARYKGDNSIEDYIEDISIAYLEILKELSKLGTEWIQFDEPILVTDLDQEDIRIFKRIYSNILKEKSDIKILLQTYFGDIRNCYKDIINLDFDGLGLDFIEGKETFKLIMKYGFPDDKILFAGVLNGKNIWRNNYKNSLKILQDIKNYTKNIVINTSCSLLHLPYSLNSESKLADKYKKHFAFAIEKLEELVEIKKIIQEKNLEESIEYKYNQNLFELRKIEYNPKVQDKINKLTEKDFVREPKFSVREEIQNKHFNLGELPTTTIGSFPQVAAVKANRTAYRAGKISEREYIDFNKERIKECIHLQEDIGLDVLVHGEFERNDMVEYFGENLEGYLFTEKAWVQSYGTRCVKPPIIWGDVSRKKPMTVDYLVYAQSQT
ncbi:MAG TPA: 5-methyltetrahydropteroyltriglutamate--homocysteine S-methyltransferase, partial [Clostridiales bacterium]|nr:5-methyltetrahydropteroyltriglutamate--homocysteine S-methyltransferase [Clostridiales bacterium]